MQAIRILGIRIDNITRQSLAAEAARIAREPRRLHQVCTVNPEFVMLAQQDAAFQKVLESADYNVADGVGILWAARRQGTPLPERVPGSELVWQLAGQAAQNGWRLFLLGAAPGVAEEAASVLQRRYPTLQIAGTWAGSPASAENDDILARINASRADLLYVAYGAPRQDKWIARNRHAFTTVWLALGIGGSLDFIAGRVPRAPVWVQRLWLEWLYRAVRQPRRWRRLLLLPRFVWLTLRKRAAA